MKSANFPEIASASSIPCLHIKQMLGRIPGRFLFFQCLVCLAVTTNVYPEENYRTQYVESFGSWTANVVIDNFDDRPVAWFVFAKDEGDEDSWEPEPTIRYICDTRDSSLKITGKTGSIFSSIGRMFGDESMKVRIRVDERDVQEFEGVSPDILIKDSDIRRAYDEFTNGLTLRVRTITKSEQHTFKVSLYGFQEAFAWVHSNCPLPDPRDET